MNDSQDVVKIDTYLRIGRQKTRGKYKVVASVKPSQEPLRDGTDRWSKPMPTVFLHILVEIPVGAFLPPNIFDSVAVVQVPRDRVRPCIEVVDPMEGTE